MIPTFDSNFNEREFLKDIIDPREGADDELLNCNDYYKWNYLLAKMITMGRVDVIRENGLASTRIAEIGTYRGYSAYSFLRGCRDNGLKWVDFYSFDNCSFDGEENYIKVLGKLIKLFPGYHIAGQIENTQEVDFLGVRDIDLFYVDGDHSYTSCKHDLRLAAQVVANDGIIMVDDMRMGGVAKVVMEFVTETGRVMWTIPHFRGLAILVSMTKD